MKARLPPPLSMPRALLLSITAAFLLLNAACGVEERRSGLPAAAQSSIDNITSDMARGDYEKIYAEAAEEWRQTTGADESRARLERIRNQRGNLLSRAQLSAQERGSLFSTDTKITLSFPKEPTAWIEL